MTETQPPYITGADTTESKRREIVTSHLKIDVEQLRTDAPPFAEALEKLLLELDSPVAWLKVSNVRLVAQSLKQRFERIDGLLGMLEEQAMEKQKSPGGSHEF